MNVESRAAQHIQARLDLRGGGRKGFVGRGRRDNDDVDGVGVHARIVKGARRRFEGDIRSRFLFARHVTHFDPGALIDPRIGGIHHFRQIEIGENLCRKKRTAAQNDGSPDSHEATAWAAAAPLGVSVASGASGSEETPARSLRICAIMSD